MSPAVPTGSSEPMGPADPDCPFCKIVAGELPARIVWESDLALAFHDIEPAAPVHILIVPRVHVRDALALDVDHALLLAEMLVIARKVAEAEAIASSGFRLVFNVGADGGNTVSHLHLHLLGGRPMVWPPG